MFEKWQNMYTPDLPKSGGGETIALPVPMALTLSPTLLHSAVRSFLYKIPWMTYDYDWWEWMEIQSIHRC